MSSATSPQPSARRLARIASAIAAASAPRGVAAGPDRPHGLVGDDEARVGAAPPGRDPPKAPRELGVDDLRSRARPRGPRAPRRRTGSAAARRRPPGRASGRSARRSRRRTHAARSGRGSPTSRGPASIGDGDLARVRAGGLVVDVLRPDARRPRRPARRARRRGTRTADRSRGSTPGSRVRDAIVRASSPASAGVVFIFQLAAITIGRMARSCQRRRLRPCPSAGLHGRMPAARARRPMPSSSWSASRSSRSSARWTAERWRSRRAAISDSDASGVSRRASATARTMRGCSASRPSASSASIAASWRPAAATARWRLADSALRTRLRSPRSDRATLPRLELQQRRAAADPAAGTCRSVSALFHVTTPRPRRSRHAAGSPTSASRAREVRRLVGAGRRTRGGSGRAARLSEPRARNRPRSHAQRQWSGGRRPVERRRAAGRGGACVARPASRRAGRRAGRPPAPRARIRGAEPGDLGAPVAGARRGRSPRARRGAPRRGRGRRRLIRWRQDAVRARRARGRRRCPRLARPRAADRGREPGGVVVVGVLRVDDVVEDEPRPAARSGRAASGAGPARQPAGRRRARRTGCSRGRRRRGRARRGARAPRGGRRGRSPSVSPGCVATLQANTTSAPARRRSRRGSRGRAARGRMLVYRLPGPEHDQLGLGDRAQRVVGRRGRPAGVDPHPRRSASLRAIRLWPSTSVPSRGPAWSVSGVARRRHDLAAHGEHAVHLADRLLEVAVLERGHRREQEVAHRMAAPRLAPRPRDGARRCAGRSAPPGNRYWSSRPISGSASASATMQLRMSPTAGIPSSSRSTPDDPPSSATVTTAVRLRGVLLEPAQERREARAAAERHDPRAAREEPLLVDHLDHRLVALPERERVDAARARGGTRRRGTAPTPSVRGDEPAELRTAGPGA